jgi:glucosamine-6-phosphate deaminase
MRVVVLNDPAAVGIAAAAAVEGALAAAPGATKVLGVATGGSPLNLYRELGSRADDGRFASVTAFALDEYLGIDRRHPESYHAVVDREVTRRLGLDPANVHVPASDPSDASGNAARYEDAIRAAGGVDVQIVGIGVNGHLGFNEPGSAFDSRTRVVELDRSTIVANSRYFASEADVPTRAITQGLGTIAEARTIIGVATGLEKAQALKRLVSGPLTPACPASILRTHPAAMMFVDAAAAALLDADPASGIVVDRAGLALEAA